MKALSLSDLNAMGCLIPSSVTAALATYATGLEREVPVSIMFGLPHNVVSVKMADQWLRSVEDVEEVQRRHAGPVTQRSLDVLGKAGGMRLAWMEYRTGILLFLEGEGVTGVGELMRSTVKGIMETSV